MLSPDAIPKSRLEVLPGVGHFPHVESPIAVADILDDFIVTTRQCRPDESKTQSRPWRGERRHLLCPVSVPTAAGLNRRDLSVLATPTVRRSQPHNVETRLTCDFAVELRGFEPRTEPV